VQGQTGPSATSPRRMGAPVRCDKLLRRDHAPERHPHPAAKPSADGRGDQPLALSPCKADDDPAHARALQQAALRSSRERRHTIAAAGAAGAEEAAVQDLLLRCILNWACALVGLGATVSEPCVVFATAFWLCLWVLEREEETPASVLNACHEGTTGCVVAAFWHSRGVLARLFAASLCLFYVVLRHGSRDVDDDGEWLEVPRTFQPLRMGNAFRALLLRFLGG